MADVTISQLSLGTPNKNSAVIPYSDGSTTLSTAPSGIVAASPGALIQVQFTHLTSGFRTASNSYQRVYGVSITPKSINSKILINASVLMCAESWNPGPPFINLRRNTTELTYQRPNNWAGSASDTYNNPFNVNLQFLDSTANTTSSIDYNICVASAGQGYNTTVNFRADGNDVIHGYSTITAMEIAG